MVEILANRIRAKISDGAKPDKWTFTRISTLDELNRKISDALSTSDPLQVQNARSTGCVRNVAGHNLKITKHAFFQKCDEVFSRMLSLMMYAKGQRWIKTL